MTEEFRQLSDAQLAAKIELMRRRAWDDFYYFAKYVCGRDLMEEQPHREMCDFAQAGLDKWADKDGNSVLGLPPRPGFEEHGMTKKLLMVPRNSFKSTIITNAFIIWLLWHNPNLRIMIDSETLANAKLYLAGVKDMIANNELIKVICINKVGEYTLEPNLKIPGGFTEESIILKLRTRRGLKEPTVFCAGVDNARTGMHPDVIIMDDLVSERNVGTPEQIEKVKNHYKYSLSLLEIGGLQIVVGTRYHFHDLYADLLRNEHLEKYVRPAILPDGSLFFPSRLSHDFLDEQRKSQGTYIYSCQYMLNPVDDEDATFRKVWLKYFDEEPRIVDEMGDYHEENALTEYILVDLAISESKKADYSVIMRVGVTQDSKVYVLHYNRGRLNPSQVIEAIFDAYKASKGRCRMVGIETVAFQKVMIFLLKNEMRRRGIYMPLKELKADRNKNRRIQGLVPLFENGDIYIRRNMVELENELLEFPFGEHDDIIDALAYLLQVYRVRGKVVEMPYVYAEGNRVTGY